MVSSTGCSLEGERLMTLERRSSRSGTQGLAQLPRARLYLLEQPDVLDRDHRLVSEGRNQIDLLCVNGFDLIARQRDHADGDAVRISGTPSNVRNPPDFLRR